MNALRRFRCWLEGFIESARTGFTIEVHGHAYEDPHEFELVHSWREVEVEFGRCARCGTRVELGWRWML